MPTAPAQPVSRRFAGIGLDLHYLDWGAAAAEPLIFLHGNRDHARSWDDTARALLPRYRVIALDLRGHGDSDPPANGAYLLPYHVEDLVALVEHLGLERVTLVGHSFGGSVTSRYAALYPDRVIRMVTVEGFGPAPQNEAAWAAEGPVQRTRDWIAQRRAAQTKPPRRLASIEEAIARMAKANPRLAPDQVRHLATHGVRPDGDGFTWKYDPRVSAFAPEDFSTPITDYWRAITAPTLIVRGADSWTADPEADGRAAALRDRRTLTIDDAGHWPHHDKPDQFVAAVKAFLDA